MNSHLSTAIYKILKPLVSLMFRNGFSFGEFSRIAKHVYVEITEKELLASGQKATTSSIAIVTGLTRKDVAALRKETNPKYEQGLQRNRAIRVIGGWVADPNFSSREGHPNVLETQGSQGSFELLVTRYSGDVPYKAMLKELLRSGAVESVGENRVALIRAAYIPSNDENSSYDILGEDVTSLISTIKYNIVSEGREPRFQRKVSYDQIPAEYLDEFKKIVNKENQLLLLKLNDWLAQHDMDTQEKITSENPMKVGVGVYYFEDSSKSSRGKEE